MAHHFDTELARKDPRLNICDYYLFASRPGFTTMVMTVDGDTLISSSDTLHPEGIYAFRFDTDGDAREDVIFKFRFQPPRHDGSDKRRHIQDFTVVRASGDQMAGTDGEPLLAGMTGGISEADGGDIRVFVGLAPELWAADAEGFRQIVAALGEEDRFDRDAFVGGRNFFDRRNVIAIVLEIPNPILAETPVRGWATISLFGHAPEVQVGRFGFPLFTFLLLAERPDLFDRYHQATPTDDLQSFGDAVDAFAQHLASRASGMDQDALRDHGADIVARFCPSMIPYEPTRPSEFTMTKINGRPLLANAHSVMWTIVGATDITDGNEPPAANWRAAFPFYGNPHTDEEQHDLPQLDPESTYVQSQVAMP